MIERNGPGLMKTERRSPMMTSGVATPHMASNNITIVIAIPATSPASNPAVTAFDLLMTMSILVGLQRDAQERGDDACARDERSTQCAGDFRDAAGAATMIHGNFQAAEPGARGFYLHLQIPTVGFFAHR